MHMHVFTTSTAFQHLAALAGTTTTRRQRGPDRRAVLRCGADRAASQANLEVVTQPAASMPTPRLQGCSTLLITLAVIAAAAAAAAATAAAVNEKAAVLLRSVWATALSALNRLLPSNIMGAKLTALTDAEAAAEVVQYGIEADNSVKFTVKMMPIVVLVWKLPKPTTLKDLIDSAIFGLLFVKLPDLHGAFYKSRVARRRAKLSEEP